MSNARETNENSAKKNLSERDFRNALRESLKVIRSAIPVKEGSARSQCSVNVLYNLLMRTNLKASASECKVLSEFLADKRGRGASYDVYVQTVAKLKESYERYQLVKNKRELSPIDEATQRFDKKIWEENGKFNQNLYSYYKSLESFTMNLKLPLSISSHSSPLPKEETKKKRQKEEELFTSNKKIKPSDTSQELEEEKKMAMEIEPQTTSNTPNDSSKAKAPKVASKKQTRKRVTVDKKIKINRKTKEYIPWQNPNNAATLPSEDEKIHHKKEKNKIGTLFSHPEIEYDTLILKTGKKNTSEEKQVPLHQHLQGMTHLNRLLSLCGMNESPASKSTIDNITDKVYKAYKDKNSNENPFTYLPLLEEYTQQFQQTFLKKGNLKTPTLKSFMSLLPKEMQTNSLLMTAMTDYEKAANYQSQLTILLKNFLKADDPAIKKLFAFLIDYTISAAFKWLLQPHSETKTMHENLLEEDFDVILPLFSKKMTKKQKTSIQEKLTKTSQDQKLAAHSVIEVHHHINATLMCEALTDDQVENYVNNSIEILKTQKLTKNVSLRPASEKWSTFFDHDFKGQDREQSSAEIRKEETSIKKDNKK